MKSLTDTEKLVKRNQKQRKKTAPRLQNNNSFICDGNTLF